MLFEQVAREFLRAVRGKRSQVAFSRRLGFRSNVCAKWESGSRMPTAALTLKICARAGIDVQAALKRFRPTTAELLTSITDENVARWLAASRGEQPLVMVASRSRLSRFRVARFLSGESRPRLPEFLALVSALTGRLTEFVDLLVEIQSVPSLHDDHARLIALRDAVYKHPWSSAVVALFDTEKFKSEQPPTIDEVATVLGISRETAAQCLRVLVRAGVLRRRGRSYKLKAPLVIDTRAQPNEERALRQHWVEVSKTRLADPKPRDLYGFSIFAIARRDYEALRKLQADYYQRVRALIADSSSSEVIGLISLHLLQWEP